MQIQSIIVGLLAAVAMAAPAVDIEARQAGRVEVQACACMNEQGKTTIGACLNGWGSSVDRDGQEYVRRESSGTHDSNLYMLNGSTNT